MPAGTEWHEAAEGRRLARARTRRPKVDASSVMTMLVYEAYADRAMGGHGHGARSGDLLRLYVP